MYIKFIFESTEITLKQFLFNLKIIFYQSYGSKLSLNLQEEISTCNFRYQQNLGYVAFM